MKIRVGAGFEISSTLSFRARFDAVCLQYRLILFTDYKVDSTKDPRSHRLNMTLVSYSLNGHLKSIETVNGAMFQMCKYVLHSPEICGFC